MPRITNPVSLHQFFQKIDATTTVITPNRRLSATLHKLYQQYQIEQQQTYWLTPTILAFSSWIEHLFNELTTKTFDVHPYLLNAAQTQFIWETILTTARENDFLLQIAETAEFVQSAWNLLKQWQIDIEHPIFKIAEDYTAFQRWAIQFQQMCKEKNWIDSASMPDWIAEKIKNKQLRPSAKIILTGFTDLSPQWEHLFTLCEENGCHVDHVHIAHDPHQCERTYFNDHEEEILMIARWAKSLFKQYPDATIGCVIPSLHQSRDRIKQIFTEVFHDDHTDHFISSENYFNISAGKKLIQYPIINTCLQVLALYKKSVSIETMSHLLTSPFIGEAEIERNQRAHFDMALRQANVHTIDITELINEKPEKNYLSLTTFCPALAKRLRHFFTIYHAQNHTLSYGQWAALFNQCLSILGWPGERSLSSDEYQIVEYWLHFLTEFMTLDHVSAPIHISRAFHQLYQLAFKSVFQPRSPEAPIQVLGVLEAAGLPFDYLWIAGMDDLSWPPPPRPNPFIPKQIQRKWQMPHATAERELLFCKTLIHQFKSSAKSTLFSHAIKNENILLQPSSLILDLPILSSKSLSLVNFNPQSLRIYQSKQTEYVCDETAPLFSAEEKNAGGVDIIKQQSLCPFKAFAKHRLKAHDLESPTLGLRPKDRGNIIHQSLEIIWNQLQNQETLIAMSDTSLRELIGQAIDDAMIVSVNSELTMTSYFKKTYLKLEKERLLTLLFAWMQIEKKRDPFRVVTHEKTTLLALNQLHLTIRIDRIDELNNGQKMIIDYKTGKNNEIKYWFSHRPEEPQLPLYSLTDPANTAGLAFAQITIGDLCLKGISRFTVEFKGFKSISEIKNTTALSWDEQINLWKKILLQLGDDFYQGKAQVNPKEPQVCLWCTLKPLCRIEEDI